MERGGVTRQFSEEWLAERIARSGNAELVKLRRGGSQHGASSPRVVPVAAAPSLPPLTVVKPPKAERDALPDELESDIQRDVMSALDAHPAVAWVARMNVDRRGTTLKSGFKGMSDILGQLHTGQFLAVEVKRRWTNPTWRSRLAVGAMCGWRWAMERRRLSGWRLDCVRVRDAGKAGGLQAGSPALR
jgi:hypothetical protein